MPDPRTDEIAREAARLIQTGRAADIPDAMRRAVTSLGYDRARLPGSGRIRKHAQAMSMAAMGDAAYRELRLKVWRIAEQVMTVFEHIMPEAHSLLVGRAAEGLIDAGVVVHIRLHTKRTDVEIAQALIEFGYDEPAFGSVETRHGRLQQVRFMEDGQQIVLTRCTPDLAEDRGTDLVTGRAIEALTLGELRRVIDQSSGR